MRRRYPPKKQSGNGLEFYAKLFPQSGFPNTPTDITVTDTQPEHSTENPETIPTTGDLYDRKQ